MTGLTRLAVDRAIRKVAQLRTLFRRLPHLPTPAESRLLAEFEALRTGRATTCSTAAVRAGFRAAWAARDYRTILSVAQKLPPDVVQGDATILMYVDNAALRAGDGEEGGA